jgi:ATP-dependent DNA helicase PIF1
MRSVIAVIASIVFLGIGWLLVGGILGLLGWLFVKTGYASDLGLLIHLFAIWVLSPGFAAALAITATTSIFRSVPLSTIYVGFISVCATSSLLLALISFSQGQATITIVVTLFQVAAIFLGAYVGRALSASASRDQDTPAVPIDVRHERASDTPKIVVPQTEPITITEPPKVVAEPKTEPWKPIGDQGTSIPTSDRRPNPNQIEVTGEFQTAIQFVSQRLGNLFITGRAGTGKSTLLRQIKDIRTSNVAILAPTGLAAVNVGGQTIHSFFKFKPGLLRPDDIKISRNAATYRKLDTIIIDEISMVRADLMEAIDRFLRLNRGRPRDPFGGVQVILVGDLHQLPPVVDDPEVERYLRGHFGGVYFFNANAFQGSHLRYSELTKKFRQSDPLFGGILDRVSEGNHDTSDLELLNRNVTSIDRIAAGIQSTILAPRNRTVFDLNMRFLNELSGPETEMAAAVEGEFDPSSFPTDQSLRLKIGAKVVLLRNDSRKRWVNGTMAKIARLENGRVWILFRGAEHELEREVWEKIKYEYDEERKTIVKKTIGSFKQFPLRLAWALTIHKSQGMTLENTYLDLDGGSFAHGQTYVALSRSRSLSGLQLARPLRSSDVIFDPEAVGYRQLCSPVSV